VYAASSYPAGRLSDRIDRRLVLVAGCVALVAADLMLALAGGVWPVMAGVVLWGLHLGLTQGLFAAMVTDATPARIRGSAFGVFNLVSGGAMLVASVLAGWLWDRYGAPATFYMGAGFTLVALAGLAKTLTRGAQRG
jgi:MFS family permease